MATAPAIRALSALGAPTMTDHDFAAATAVLSGRLAALRVRFVGACTQGTLSPGVAPPGTAPPGTVEPSDAELPALLAHWFRHALARAPDDGVLRLSTQIERFFGPEFGHRMPCDWPWDTRDLMLYLNSRLRARLDARDTLPLHVLCT